MPERLEEVSDVDAEVGYVHFRSVQVLIGLKLLNNGLGRRLDGWCTGRAGLNGGSGFVQRGQKRPTLFTMDALGLRDRTDAGRLCPLLALATLVELKQL